MTDINKNKQEETDIIEQDTTADENNGDVIIKQEVDFQQLEDMDFNDHTIIDKSENLQQVTSADTQVEEKPIKHIPILDNIWSFWSKEEREKRKRKKRSKTVKIVVYKPKSQLRKLLTLIIWLGFLFTLGFVFYKGYNFTNTLVKQTHAFDIKATIGEISEENKKTIYIPKGATTKDIAKTLMDEGVIVNDNYFWIYSLLMGNEGNYKSGNHIIDASVTYDSGEIDIVTAQGYEMLIYIFSQDSVPNPTKKLFFTEGLAMSQTIKIFTDNDIGDTKGFYDACDNYDYDYDFIKQIPNDSRRTNRLEGYLFPDTYIFDITASESNTINRMLENFNAKFNESYREKAELMGYTIDEIVIIASMLEKESATMEEKAMIAGVIYNRLNSKDTSMNYLQIDATIQYIYINETGAVKEMLTNEDHQILNSYNTYMYKGLPPGPICNPSLSSIAAALYPETHNYYYYVAKNDGTDAHAYATTLAQHNYNVSLYSK